MLDNLSIDLETHHFTQTIHNCVVSGMFYWAFCPPQRNGDTPALSVRGGQRAVVPPSRRTSKTTYRTVSTCWQRMTPFS